ncbi:cold shock domain-containing protein [Methanococcoides sp. SA1]|nr:cold shock domain-containing protein [Methanococcoides sp. SA1]
MCRKNTKGFETLNEGEEVAFEITQGDKGSQSSISKLYNHI